MKRPPSHPPHLFVENTWYMITGATLDRARYLAEDGAKDFVRDTLRDLVVLFHASLLAWVILDNHYHLLLKPKAAEQIPFLIARLNGASSRHINLASKQTGRKVWHNYWDACVRDESDLWTKFNYVHQNPVKHGYIQQACDWAHSSYGYYARTRGRDWLDDCLGRYPVIDFTAGDDKFD